MKSVLILMSTYNGEKFLEQQIDSILNQKNVDVSILIRDDGSKDGTIDILKKYKESNNNVDFICGNNINWMHSFWYLVNCARGFDYYAFSDQDDIWDEDKLYKAVSYLNEYENCPCIYCANQRIINDNMEVINSTEEKVKIDDFKIQDFLVRGNLFRGCTEVWNNCLQEYILNLKIDDIDEPHDAVIMLICLCVGKVFKDNSDVMSYCQHNNNALGVQTRKDRIKFIFNNLMGKDGYKKPFSTRLKKVKVYVNNDISEELKPYFKQVCEYDKTFINTIKLALSSKYPNMTMKKRIQILLRKF